MVSNLGVMSRITGHDVAVETRVVSEPAVEALQRMLWRRPLDYGLDGSEGFELPLRIEIVADDRQIVVDGHPVTFEGVRRTGSEVWSGAALVDGLWVQVDCPGDVGPIELLPCRAPDQVPMFPPP